MTKKRKRRLEQQHRPGSAPGQIDDLVVAGGEPTVVEIVDYTHDAVEQRFLTDSQTVSSPQRGYRWIRVRGVPDRTLLHALREGFGIHPLVLEDAVSLSHRIKSDVFDSYLFSVVRNARDEYVRLILTSDTLITIDESEDKNYFEALDARLATPTSLIRRSGVDFLFEAVIDLVVDGYFPAEQELEEQALDTEARILDAAGDQDLRTVHRIRARSAALRSSLWALRDMLTRLDRSPTDLLSKDTRLYFGDVLDHVTHLIDLVTVLRENAAALMELYLSGISNRTNSVMKVLTIISTLFIPITFIVGVYGMNFVHMPELELRWAYPAVWIVMGIVVTGMLIYFRRRKWI